MSCPRPDTPRSDPRDWGQIANPLRDRAWSMSQDYGLVLNSGYRDPGRQWDLRHERVPGHECDPRYQGTPTTAVPATLVNGIWVGGSKHQHRQAVDLDGTQLTAAYRNCWRYGLSAPVRGEKWHFQVGTSPPSPEVNIRSYPGPNFDDTVPVPPEEEEEGILSALTEDEQKDAYRILKALEADYLSPGRSVRQVIVETAQRTKDLVSGKRPRSGP